MLDNKIQTITLYNQPVKKVLQTCEEDTKIDIITTRHWDILLYDFFFNGQYFAFHPNNLELWKGVYILFQRAVNWFLLRYEEDLPNDIILVYFPFVNTLRKIETIYISHYAKISTSTLRNSFIYYDEGEFIICQQPPKLQDIECQFQKFQFQRDHVFKLLANKFNEKELFLLENNVCLLINLRRLQDYFEMFGSYLEYYEVFINWPGFVFEK